MSKITDEQIAHDLAIAVVTAQLSKESNPKADKMVIRHYEVAYETLLDLLPRLR